MQQQYFSEQQIQDLYEKFSQLTLPKEQWTHAAHLTVALYHLYHHSVDEAACFLRSGIITYNHSLGNQNTAESGYHECITIFWIKVIGSFVAAHRELNLLDCCNAFLASRFAERDFPFQFYTKELLMSTAARAFWTEPDKQKIELNFE